MEGAPEATHDTKQASRGGGKAVTSHQVLGTRIIGPGYEAAEVGPRWFHLRR